MLQFNAASLYETVYNFSTHTHSITISMVSYLSSSPLYNYVLIIFVSCVSFCIGIVIGYCISKNHNMQKKNSLTERYFTLKSKSKRINSNNKLTSKELKHSTIDKEMLNKFETSSDDKFLNRVLHSNLQFNKENISIINDDQYDTYGEFSKSKLLSILGLSQDNSSISNKIPWQHVYSNTYSHFWVSNSSEDIQGIKLRGESYANCSPIDIVKLILHQDMITGIEGLYKKSQIISYKATSNMIIITRKLTCKSGSGSLMSSKRQFKLITFLTTSDGNIYTSSNIYIYIYYDC